MARREIFMVWESNCRNILDELSSLPEKMLDDIKLRVFLRKDTPFNNRPRKEKWIDIYDTFTTAPYASYTTLVTFLVKYFRHLAFLSPLGTDGEDKVELYFEPMEFYFIVDSDEERKYDELVAILTQEYASSGVRFFIVNGQTEHLPKIFGFEFCKICCKSFESDEMLQAHNVKMHNIFCENELCPKNKSPFRNMEEYYRHKSMQTKCLKCGENSPVFCKVSDKIQHMQIVHGQEDISQNTLSCDFCPKKVFTSQEQLDTHMKNTHKKCNCGCAMYFETREDYLRHFYTVYPLACYENRKCPHRFKTVIHQAAHHESIHNSKYPYYCVVCFKQNGGRQAQTCVFKDKSSLENHGRLMRHSDEEMFLVFSTSCKPTAKSSAINYC
ncbi:zinc finger protein 28-like [Xenia sp. Carnegie-2017]|uniref:zinc finger protein 28-like n=1 Tax=Xenia sp. Carnegie-2017 TaxID=2897299 RepID=UPI001F03CC4B|nr:zinc finger protein 28-like [Xenia sp. Carnegie-2017]